MTPDMSLIETNAAISKWAAFLRYYQSNAVATAVQWARQTQPGQRYLIASPTGTGKSFILLALQDILDDAYIVVPNIQIMAGLIHKRGLEPSSVDSVIKQQGASQGIYTPVTLRNKYLDGSLRPAKFLLPDEAHHDSEDGEVGDQLNVMGQHINIGVTATPYRGTMQSTGAFYKRWGKPNWAIRIPQAIKDGYWTLPKCTTWPLVNDDEVDIVNGQLSVSQIEAATDDKMVHLIERMIQHGIWTNPRATVITMPGTRTALRLYEMLRELGLPCNVITQATSWRDRKTALDTINTVPLIQIRTIGEGVDLPIRLMIDAAPSLSPNLWFQRFGRLTRPGGESEYVCTNLNLIRHCYLLEGCLPESSLRDATKLFDGGSERSCFRAFGIESLGKLKPAKIKTVSGIEVHAYAVSTSNGNMRRDYCVIVHPLKSDPFWFQKDSRKQGEALVWGEWERVAPPELLDGYASLKPNPLTQKQADWWQRAAATHNVDPEQKVTGKLFQVLPILAKFGVRL